MRRRLATALPAPAKQLFAHLARDHAWLYRVKVAYLASRADIFLISFPKCGRTWLRVMLGKAMRDHFGLHDLNIMRFTDIRIEIPGVPRILAMHDDSPQVKAPERLIRGKSAYRGRPVVFLARDPRDVIVSLYFHRTRRRQEPYSGSLSDFLRERVGSLDSLIAFYNLWAAQQEVPLAFLLVRYEDLHARPSAELRRVLDFMGLESIDDVTVREAVEFASFERMQTREREGRAGSRALHTENPGDPNSYKTRRGIIGGYVDYLSADDVSYLEQRMRELHPLFGYSC